MSGSPPLVGFPHDRVTVPVDRYGAVGARRAPQVAITDDDGIVVAAPPRSLCGFEIKSFIDIQRSSGPRATPRCSTPQA